MMRVTLDFKNDVIVIETEYQQTVSYQQQDKDIMLEYLSDIKLIDAYDNYTFDFDISTVSINLSVSLKENNAYPIRQVIPVHIFTIPGLYLKQKEFLTAINASKDVRRKAMQFNSLYESLHSKRGE